MVSGGGEVKRFGRVHAPPAQRLLFSVFLEAGPASFFFSGPGSPFFSRANIPTLFRPAPARLHTGLGAGRFFFFEEVTEWPT